MTRAQKKAKKTIINKYNRLIGQTIKRMGDNTMGELWVELDKLKAEMQAEFEKAGIELESQ